MTDALRHRVDQCRRLASRGVLAASAGYRLIDSGAATLSDCALDFNSPFQRASGRYVYLGLME